MWNFQAGKRTTSIRIKSFAFIDKQKKQNKFTGENTQTEDGHKHKILYLYMKRFSCNFDFFILSG